MANGEEMVGLAEAAVALRIPYQAAHRLLMLGELRGVKRSNRWLVREDDVARLVKERGERASGASGQQ
jgi:predicted site-specific integrase-resolvase